MSRHLMQPDPDAPPLRLTTALWIVVFILAVVLVLGLRA
jgi:hypothetical protein